MVRFIRNTAICLTAAVIVLGLGHAMAFITFNEVNVYPSYLLGSLGIFGALFIIAVFYLASTDVTSDLVGTLLGLGTAIVMVATFSLSDFGWGALDLVIVAASTGIIAGTAHLYKKS